MNPRNLPYMLLFPATAFLAVFFVYPFVLVAVQAFTNEAGFTLEHFQTMADDWKFKISFWNTILLAIAVVPLQTCLALMMAKLVTSITTGRDIYLYIFTIPLGISDLAAGIIWLAIFEQSGFLNTLLFTVGAIDQPVILLGYQSTWIIFLAVVLAELWRATAIMLVILVAGMGLIPKEYDEAAEVFGASRWQRFVKVTLPLLRPSLQTALILRTILAFEVFAVVAALGGTTLPVLMGETFKWQFEFRDESVAAALAMVILAISIGFTLFFLRALRVPKEAQI
ncbi:MAG: sugar ABC transporter permease [Stappiaceae bacterium]